MRPIKTTMLILKPKVSKINLKIRLYPKIKTLRTFKGILVRFIYILFLNILKSIGNLRKPILFIGYCLKRVNKKK
jgi:hypothetical protein